MTRDDEAPTPASIRADMIGLDSVSLARGAALVADLRLMCTAPPQDPEKWQATKREYLSRIVVALDDDTGGESR